MKYLFLLALAGCGVNMEADVYEPRKQKEEAKEAHQRYYERTETQVGKCVCAYATGGYRDTVCVPERYADLNPYWMVNAGRLEAYVWTGYEWVLVWRR